MANTISRAESLRLFAAFFARAVNAAKSEDEQERGLSSLLKLVRHQCRVSDYVKKAAANA